jgi:hypothetical protein
MWKKLADVAEVRTGLLRARGGALRE